MTTDMYRKLARHLDNLPGGYPATESGVELRILRRLFTPEEAELATHLTLLPEEGPVIARRAGLDPEAAAQRLDEMEKKGLIFAVHPKGGPPVYMASQFVVGIYEYQVARMDEQFVRDMNEYMPSLLRPEVWKKVPQLRTIPVGRSVTPTMEVMPYERAEELVRSQKRIAVAPCICRKEKHMLGEGCDKPLDVCMSFGMGAEYYVRNGQGRRITQEEALAILDQADEAGLVLQPGNAKDAKFICACCGDCCGVLTTLKRYPKPATLVSTPFVASLVSETCQACGTCVERCQMEALTLGDTHVMLDVDRCIGCGLCVSTCPSGSLTLARKPGALQKDIPDNVTETSIRLAQARGKMGLAELMGMKVRSTVDRAMTPR